jgi:hypothetical protein
MFTIKNITLSCMLAFIALCSSAQQKITPVQWQFHSINNVGLLEGQAGSAFQLQTINGVQHKSWFGGIGLGLDYYRFRTIPLFIDVRKEFGKGENKFFVYADAGVNFYWRRDNDVKQFPLDDSFKNGFYAEPGAGYKWKLSRKLSFLFSAGYSYKKMIEKGSYLYDFPDLAYPGPANYSFAPSAEKINYNCNRLVLKAGIRF